MRTAIRITSVILCLILLFCLFSCGASMERLEARAKKAGYACITVSSEELAERNAYFDKKTDNAGDIVSIMLFQKDGKTVEAFEFDTVSTAEIYVKHLKVEIQEPFLYSAKGEFGAVNVKRRGRIVIFGDESMIKELW